MNKNPKKILIFIGPPGSGKGTQAKIIAKKFGFKHLSTGDLLRALANKNDLKPIEKEAVKLMKNGQLVSDQLIYDLVFDEAREIFKSGSGVVFDGAIRNVEQAKEYQKFFIDEGLGREVRVIDIALADEESLKRLSARQSLEGRSDDSKEVVLERLRIQGNPALEPIRKFYRDLGLLYQIEGNQSVDQVYVEIEQAVCL